MKKVLIILFAILYLSVAFVSTWHAVAFFGLSNPMFLGIILALAFEIGQAAVLFTLLMGDNQKKPLPWILMSILTLVQVLGNVYSSYFFMVSNNADKIQYFTKSVLFFVQSPNPDYNYVMISYITGAILPIVSLCLTAMVVNILKQDKKDKMVFESKNEIKEKELEDKLYT